MNFSNHIYIAMKLHTLIITSALSATAFAGEVQQSSCSNCWDGWFAGATFGQFADTDARVDGDTGNADQNLYALHVGRNLNRQLLGCDLAGYVEAGLLEANYGPIDIDVIPFTFNLKAERELFAGINGYVSAGAGYAFSRVSMGSMSFGDGGIYGQGSIGLSYDINENVEIFGGARYIVLDEVDFGIPSADADNNVGYEVGLRYNF
jgi:opacity protein-like surface antigen